MEKRASILLEALPYIQRFHGKTLVIKLGGSILEDDDVLDSTCQDVVLLNYVGMKLLIIHGGGTEITREMEKIGKKPKFIEGLRVTDKETMEILHKSLGGKINKKIVLGLEKYGGKAMGITGIDGGLVRAKRIEGESEELGLVGEVEEIDPTVIEYLINTGFIPVIAPMGADAEGNSLNLNADIVAAELASALRAGKFVLLTDVSGVLEDPEDDTSLISHLTLKKAQKLIKGKKITRGMIPKVKACTRSVEKGVERAHIINGTLPHAILLEVLTESGIGTMIERG